MFWLYVVMMNGYVEKEYDVALKLFEVFMIKDKFQKKKSSW